jgi:hypothetical protein
MRIAVTVLASRTVPSKTMQQLKPDPLAEFCAERPAPIRPVIVRATPRASDVRRVVVARVLPPQPRFTFVTRSVVWSFALGSLFGAMVCLIALSWF